MIADVFPCCRYANTPLNAADWQTAKTSALIEVITVAGQSASKT